MLFHFILILLRRGNVCYEKRFHNKTGIKMKEEKKTTMEAPGEMLECISDLFMKYGLRSTSMDDICTHLKISKKTLYNYFDNKDHLVEKVMLHRRSSFRLESMKEQIKPYTGVEVLLYTSAKITAMLQSQIPANSFDMKKYHPAVFEKITRQDEERMGLILNTIIEKGKAEGSFRKDLDQDIQVYLLTKQIGQMCDPEILVRLAYPMEKIVITIIENFIRGIATEKGIKELEEKIKDVQDMLRIAKEKKEHKI